MTSIGADAVDRRLLVGPVQQRTILHPVDTVYTLIRNLVFVLVPAYIATGGALAEEFKYYVWIDEQGIVHADQEAPKGRDYQVRVIEDINANVVPAEDFRVFGDDLLPAYESSAETGQGEPGGDDAEDAADRQAEDQARNTVQDGGQDTDDDGNQQ